MNTEMQLFSISRKKKPEYEHGVAHKVYENKLNQDFHANAINLKWCTDFTYLFLTDGSKRYNCTIVSMLVRYHPEKWKTFCESSDIAIIRKLLINCRREMLVEVIQLLSGKEYAFTTVMEEMDAELDASEVYKLVKEEAWREYKRTGRNTLIF